MTAPDQGVLYGSSAMAYTTISPKVWTVYRITNTVNGKCYVGITRQSLEKRWRNHINTAKNCIDRRIIGAAIRKYGPDSFTIDKLSIYFTENQAMNAEMFFIKRFNSMRPNGYNMTIGGEGVSPYTGSGFKGHTHTPETRAKMRAARKGRKEPPVSPETRAKMSAASKGRPKSAAHRAAMSAGQKGHPGTFNGRTHTAETRAKMSAAAKGRPGTSKPGWNHTAEACAKISAAKKGRKGHPQTPETCAKISAANKGRPKSLAHRAAMSAGRRGRPHIKRLEGQLEMALEQPSGSAGEHL